MGKIKIKELSEQMSLEVKDILSKCKELSIIARTQSSSISIEDAKRIQVSLVGEPILNKPKDDNNIIKRSGSRVTIRRKKKEEPKKEKLPVDNDEATSEPKHKASDLNEIKTKSKDSDTDDQIRKKPKRITEKNINSNARKVVRTLENEEVKKKPKPNQPSNLKREQSKTLRRMIQSPLQIYQKIN